MTTTISQAKLQEVLDKITQEVTEMVAGIRLYQAVITPGEKTCTVHADFHSGFQCGLSMCADLALFTRLTQYMMQQEEIQQQDIEDFVKEYFNVLCGHIAAGLFQATMIASRFDVPSFHTGFYQPESMQEQITLNYASDKNESVQLTHNLAVR